MKNSKAYSGVESGSDKLSKLEWTPSPTEKTNKWTGRISPTNSITFWLNLMKISILRGTEFLLLSEMIRNFHFTNGFSTSFQDISRSLVFSLQRNFPQIFLKLDWKVRVLLVNKPAQKYRPYMPLWAYEWSPLIG